MPNIKTIIPVDILSCQSGCVSLVHVSQGGHDVDVDVDVIIFYHTGNLVVLLEIC